MQLTFSTVDIADSHLLEGYVRRVLASALGTHATEVRSARVRLVDANGPDRGGTDKRCWVELRLGSGPDVVAEAVHVDARGAVTLSAVEAARMVARRTSTQRARQSFRAAVLVFACLATVSGCAAHAPYPLVASANPQDGLSIDEAERLAQAIEKQRGLMPELDEIVLNINDSSRQTDVEAYRLLAAAESHLLTAMLVDVLAARIHEQAARAALRTWYDMSGGVQRMGFARLQSVSKRLKLASVQLRTQAKTEREKGLALSTTQAQKRQRVRWRSRWSRSARLRLGIGMRLTRP